MLKRTPKQGAVHLIAEGSRLTIAAESPSPGGLELRCDGEIEDIIHFGPEDFSSDLLLDGNQLDDADLSNESSSWHLRSKWNVKAKLGTNHSPQWTCAEGVTGYLALRRKNDEAELVYHCPVEGEFLTTVPGRSQQASIYVALHRCKAELVLQFVDERRKIVSEHGLAVTEMPGGPSLTDYDRPVLTVQVPDEATAVRMSVRVRATDREAHMFFLRPFLGWSRSSLPVAWTPARFGARLVADLRAGTTAVRQVELWRRLRNDNDHEIALIDRATGLHASGSPVRLHGSHRFAGAINGLDGSTVTGWIKDTVEDRTVFLTVLLDGVEVARGVSSHVREQNGFAFRIGLPAAVCDGRPHNISIVSGPDRVTIDEIAAVTPALLTPWASIQAHTQAPHPAQLAPMASARYENLKTWLEAFEKAPSEGRPVLEKRIGELGLMHQLLVEGFEKRREFPPFALPRHAAPTVSIVVPVHNKMALTYNCLAALAFAYNRTSFEVVVVDDGSTDETPSLAEIVGNVVMVRNEPAQGFVGACNRGAAEARGKYIAFLNNDVEPWACWLDALVDTFDRFESVGLVGSKLIYPDGRLQDAGGIVWNTAVPWNYGRGANASDPRFNYIRQVDYLTGAAFMLPRSVWEDVGAFSEEFKPAYYEDTDLAFKVRSLGLKTLYVPGSIVCHFEGMSNGTSTSGTGLKRFQEVNAPKFRRKWIDACAGNGQEGVAVDRAKDRGVTLRALVVDAETPQPERDAGSYAAVQEMRLMLSLGIKPTFLPSNLAYLGEPTARLQDMGVETIYAPFAHSIEEFLAQRGKEFDLVYVTRYGIAQSVIPHVRRLAPRAKILFNNADLHFLRELRSAIARKDRAAMQRAVEIRDQELATMRQADLTLSYSSTEQVVILSHNLDSTKVVTCPWVVDVVDDMPPFDARRDLAFLGSFAHPPNQEAVTWFVTEVMPLLRERLPGVRLRVFGSRVTQEVRALESDDVVIEGYIEKVGDLYGSCRIFVAPLRSGAGLKGKVVDAMAHGTPSVLSPIAAEGVQLRAGIDAHVADTAQEWVDSIARLYDDEAAWSAMAEAAREQARKAYSFERAQALMRAALEAVNLFAPNKPEGLVLPRARW